MYRGTTGFNRVWSFGKRIIKPDWIPTVGNLPAAIVVNGVSANPTARHNGKDATILAWPYWTYGESLAIAGSGSEPSVSQASILKGSLDKSIVYGDGAGSKYHQAANNTYGDVATQDLHFEALVKTPSAGSSYYYVYKYTSSAGWFFYWNDTTKQWRFVIRTNSSTVASAYSPALSNSQWYFIDASINRNEASTNGMLVYANSVAGTGVDPSAAAATATVASPLRTGYTSPNASQIAYFALYLQANWFSAGATGKAEMDALSLLRWKMVKWT